MASATLAPALQPVLASIDFASALLVSVAFAPAFRFQRRWLSSRRSRFGVNCFHLSVTDSVCVSGFRLSTSVLVLAVLPQCFSFGIRGVCLSATNSVLAAFASALQFWCHSVASFRCFSFCVSGIHLSASVAASAASVSALRIRSQRISPHCFSFGVGGSRLRVSVSASAAFASPIQSVLHFV